MLYFSAARKRYSRALEIISALELSSDNKLLEMIFPFFEKNLQNVKSELFSKATWFCDKYRYSMSICALYEAYNCFAKELYEKSGFSKLDPMDSNLYRYSDLLEAMFKTEVDYWFELPEYERSDGRVDMHVRQHRYSAIVCAARRMISDGDSFEIIKKLRRYITSETKEKPNVSFNEARVDVFNKKEQSIYLKNGVLSISDLENTIREAAAELKKLNKLKDEFFELAKSKSAEQDSNSEQPRAEGDLR